MVSLTRRVSRRSRGIRRTVSGDRCAVAGVDTGGAQPHWRSSKELIDLSVNGRLMSTSLRRGLAELSPVPLFHINVPDLFGSGDYAMSADGERIVVNTFISDAMIPPIDVVVNWQGLLKN